MKTVILAGGFGTRLSEETGSIPKPMIEVGGRPLIWHIMKLYASQGFNEFVVALGYKGEVIKKYFLDYAKLQSDISVDLKSGSVSFKRDCSENWSIDLVDTGLNTMTGGRLKRLKGILPDKFFLTYGDGLANIDLLGLLDAHNKGGRLTTVTAVTPPSRFGLLGLDGSRVKAFSEKPVLSDQRVNGGFFVVEPKAIDFVSSDDVSWEAEPCSELALLGEMSAYKHDGFWQCVDTLHELRKLRTAWDEGCAPWKIW